jgi:hypothetical protein
MTEYDFSPEAYQRHLANMHRISKWVDKTEQHRPQFSNAAALDESERRGDGPRRRAPPPPLHLGRRMNSYPFRPPPHSASSSSEEEFMYADRPGSPGPMPSSIYPHPFVSPPPSYGFPSHGYSHPMAGLRPHGPGQPGYVIPPPSGFGQYPVMTRGYTVALPMKPSRKLKRRGSRSPPLIYF